VLILTFFFFFFIKGMMGGIGSVPGIIIPLVQQQNNANTIVIIARAKGIKTYHISGMRVVDEESIGSGAILLTPSVDGGLDGNEVGSGADTAMGAIKRAPVRVAYPKAPTI
jgi:hypothetical protein